MKPITTVFLFLVFVCSVYGQPKTFPPVEALPEQKTLPDPLIMFDGTPVKSTQQWHKERRPELKALFQHYMYGYLPAAPKVRATPGKRYQDFFAGKATMQEVQLNLGQAGAPKINVILFLPNRAKAPAPAILGINFCGNHTITKDARVTLNPNWFPEKMCPGTVNNKATEASRGQGIDSEWDIEAAIDRGYAVVSFYHGDLAPDTPDITLGVFPYFKAGKADKDSAWGNVAAWAWGFHRVMDYLTSNKAIDAKRIAAFGHSRNGKAAIFAAAMDERIAIVFPHQAGMGGTSPNRGTVGESVKAINDRFPHWFNDNFPRFSNNTARLPFDQHELIALMAPRPVMLSCAVEDVWSNPAGQFEVLQAADRVYRFLGVEGLNATQMPAAGTAIQSRLGYFYRAGKHSTIPADWKAFLDFADRYFVKK